MMILKYGIFFLIFISATITGFAQNQIVKPALVGYSSYIMPFKLAEFTLSSFALSGTNPGDTICTCSFYNTTVPVTLLSFNAVRINNEKVLLNWKTTHEIQNKGFDVERSLGNANLFEYINFVPAQLNNSNEKKYTLFDNNNFEGLSYYRLKQIDIDNKFVYSKIEVVKGYTNALAINLYPNPATITLTATAKFNKNDVGKLLLFDATQKLLETKSITINKGYNLYSIPVGVLTPGVYYIKIASSEGETLMTSFIKE